MRVFKPSSEAPTQQRTSARPKKPEERFALKEKKEKLAKAGCLYVPLRYWG